MHLLKYLCFTILLSLGTIVSGAQVPYVGGQADGFSSNGLQNFTAGIIAKQGPFTGGIADGYATDSLVQFNPRGTALLFAPFAGGMADGFAFDSLISFNPRGNAILYGPFYGGGADGYAYDSVIQFNPRSYIAKFTPFAAGISDGYYEAVICNFPKASNDTTVYLACAADSFNLNSLVDGYNFAARWNTAKPGAVVAGQYELRINNAGKCLDTLIAIVKLDVATWTGTTSNNWHDPANWNTGRVPGPVTHVIIPSSTPNACVISESDAACVSLQARNSGNFKITNGKQLFVNGTCTSLPSP